MFESRCIPCEMPSRRNVIKVPDMIYPTTDTLCVAVHPLEACEPIATPNLPEGTAWVGFAVRQRNCTFYDKTINVQLAGGQAIIIANDVPDGGPVGMDYRDGACVALAEMCIFTLYYICVLPVDSVVF